MLDGLPDRKEMSDEIIDGRSGRFYHMQDRDTHYKTCNAVALGKGSTACVGENKSQMK